MDFQAFITDNQNFNLWSSEHLKWLSFAVISTIFWLILGKNQKTEAAKIRVGLVMSAIPILVWFWFLFAITTFGVWKNQNILPFHLCYFLNFVMPIVLWTRRQWLFEATFFWVMGVCFQALFTPDLKSAAPCYFSLKYWFVHIGLVQSALFSVVVLGLRPRLKGVLIALAAGNLYFAFCHAINLYLSTNFMYTVQKPPETILDLLGEHHILKAQVLALVVFLVLWLPFSKPFWQRRVA